MQVTCDAKLILDCGELDDAIATIEAGGRDPEHFDFNVHRMPDRKDNSYGLHAIRFTVEVTNRMSGRVATLAGGHGEAWVLRLADKLQAGEFG